MFTKPLPIAVAAVFCCVAIASCEPLAPQEKVNDTAWVEARDLTADWPDESSAMTVEQLKQVDGVADAVAAALGDDPHDADALALQAVVEKHSAYLDELRRSLLEDVTQADLAPSRAIGGTPAYLRSVYEQRQDDWRKGEALGWPDGVWLIGKCYQEGIGVEQDYAKARELYEHAAGAGHARAMLNMGQLYDVGQGVAENDVEAVKWYRMAAEAGSIGGMLMLGHAYYLGEGVEQDSGKALDWISRAADLDDPGAIAWILGLRPVVAFSEEETLRWYRLAAKYGDAGAMFKLTEAYATGTLGLQ